MPTFISRASPQDYDTAKLLKEAETQLKSLGQQLAQLEVAKRQAVEDEDYDRAKMLKVRTATSCPGSPYNTAELVPGYVLYRVRHILTPSLCWPLFSVQVEADSLRLQIAAHPNPELRAKLEEAGVQVGTPRSGNAFGMFRVQRCCCHRFTKGDSPKHSRNKLGTSKWRRIYVLYAVATSVAVYVELTMPHSLSRLSKPQLDWCEEGF